MKVSFLAVREKGSKNGRKFTINLWVLHCSQSSVITHGFERDPQTDTEVKQNTDVCIYIYIHTYRCVHVYVCVHICVHLHMFTDRA